MPASSYGLRTKRRKRVGSKKAAVEFAEELGGEGSGNIKSDV